MINAHFTTIPELCTAGNGTGHNNVTQNWAG